MIRQSEELRSLLGRPGLMVIPSVFDAMGALVSKQVGFPAVSLTGNGLSAYMLGRPDMGLLTMSEVVQQTAYVAATGIPVIADADTGYGGPLNVHRTVQEFARAGAAAIHIEDQPIPKKCAYMGEPVRIVPVAEQMKRLRAAREAADESGILLMARTDAHRAYGLDEVLRRAEAYATVGIDGFLSATIGSLEELRRLCEAIAAPVLVNMNMAGAVANATALELEQAGAKVAVFPSVLRNAVLKTMVSVLTQLREDGDSHNVRSALAGPEVYDGILATAQWTEREQRYWGPTGFEEG